MALLFVLALKLLWKHPCKYDTTFSLMHFKLKTSLKPIIQPSLSFLTIKIKHLSGLRFRRRNHFFSQKFCNRTSFFVLYVSVVLHNATCKTNIFFVNPELVKYQFPFFVVLIFKRNIVIDRDQNLSRSKVKQTVSSVPYGRYCLEPVFPIDNCKNVLLIGKPL